METFSALLVMPVTRSFDVYFYLRPNQPLSNRAHYDVIVMIDTTIKYNESGICIYII